MFSSQLHLDHHRLSGAHDYSNRSASMDNMKHSFAEKIKQSSHFLTTPGCSSPITTNKKGVTTTLMLLKKKVGHTPNRKNLIIQKNRKAFC